MPFTVSQAPGLPTFRRNFHDLVGLANWLREHNYYVSAGPANLSEGGIWPGFKNAVKRYRGEKDILRYYVSSRILENITIHKEFSDCFKIWVPERYNPCHKRFALCKELCHILTDEESVKSTDHVSQLTRALNTVRQVLTSSETTPDVNPFFTAEELNSEDFNLLLAMEMLIPVHARDQFLSNIQMNKSSPYDIALYLRIPESLVTFFVQSGYNLAFKRVGGIECRLAESRG